MTLAIVGGSGFDRLPNFAAAEQRKVTTPYGTPSASLLFGEYCATKLVFLPRHGDEHSIAPHKINYRANMYALKDAGVTEIVALVAVGAINPDFSVGSIVIPDQIIDYTSAREHTFYDGTLATNRYLNEPLDHIDFTEPYEQSLRLQLIQAAERATIAVNNGGVYAVTQGPRFESAAEIDRLERDGAEIAGMTAMPEAALARELNMRYASIAMVANAAAGRGDRALTMETIYANLAATTDDALAILQQFITLS